MKKRLLSVLLSAVMIGTIAGTAMPVMADDKEDIRVAGVVYLAAGVVGVKQAGNTEKAGLCVGMGALLITEVIAEVLVTLKFGVFDPASVVRMLMFPAIYMVGAVLNWQARTAEKAGAKK